MCYAVINKRFHGIFFKLDEFNEQKIKFPNGKYKKCNSIQEAYNYILNIKNEHTTSSTNANNSISSNDNNKTYYAYTDGACSSNGFLGAKAGYGIYFGENDPRNVSKRVEGKQTNNVAELTAIIEAYKIIEQEKEKNNYCIVSDSKYAIRCATTYGEKCEKNNWKKDIPNKELVKEAYYLFKGNTNIIFKHIMAHTKNTDIHSIGNSYADELARQALEIV